ncbi:isocitrate dehydrogenase [NAD] subunit 2 [Niveomyces insectorum RCEF 264]|uniref:Isocitrate dehydrogenase [NAD] subunit 2 n=1 Tax=Niveomyces insectorum RCEF 264 TaxID=1081102 RepID=A0A167STK1_9HYPO|nr:isocitrate dehydrogenase [NAD] subunit 2 [Niveomyces insectorum RCEF 264]
MALRIGIMKGNGIGPEITSATQRVLEATGLPLQWEDIPVADEAVELFGHPLPPQTVEKLREVKYTIKAPFIVNKMQGRIACTQLDGSQITYPTINNAVRRELKLFVNPRPIQGYPGISGRHEAMDLVVMREITEDVYIGHEHTIGDDDMAAEAIKLTTRAAATRVARYSFDYARRHGRKRVTCLHKANVLNFTDGLFLRCFREVAAAYPDIQADDMMIDAACYVVVRDPRRFDVVVTANQYGDIFSDLAAGLAGSLGLAPGANIGDEAFVYEASHGAAPDIAGKGIANPLALVLSAAVLLDQTGHGTEAQAVRSAVRHVVETREALTPDLGGTGTTRSLTDAVVAEVKRIVSS